jgi:hypothetical protein
MNRSSGAYAPLKFKNFCIVIRLADGGYYQTIKTETNSRRALGMAFGDLRSEPSMAPASSGAVCFCKTPDQMTEDERWQWGVQTDADERRWQRHQDATRTPSYMLDLY